jgi:hypothetical protein
MNRRKTRKIIEKPKMGMGENLPNSLMGFKLLRKGFLKTFR